MIPFHSQQEIPPASQLVDGGVTAARGFSAAAAACGIKDQDQLDLALVVSDRPAAAAGVFTRNRVQGHSLQLCRQHLAAGRARAVVINSGNANACVGPQGLADAAAMAQALASQIGCSPQEILTGSTGLIGQRLPMDRLLPGIQQAAAALAPSDQAARQAEKAILTTDLRPKRAALAVTLGGKTVTIGGMAKGSGMIHPNMATMIAVITTDVACPADRLQALLARAADSTFNRISVDGDTSVCDKVLILANGAAGNPPLVADSADEAVFFQALRAVCSRLAYQIVADGEGATKLAIIQVTGAATQEDARLMAAAIARSPLVKTALFGQDANWGRILTAAGYSGASFDPSGCEVWLGDCQVCAGGQALPFDEDRAKAILQADQVLVRLVLQDGQAEDGYLTCDLTDAYIHINASYRS